MDARPIRWVARALLPDLMTFAFFVHFVSTPAQAEFDRAWTGAVLRAIIADE